MARIAGVDLPNKHVDIALTYIYGLGRSSASSICEAAGIDLHVAAEAFTLGYTGSKHVATHSAVMAEGKRNQPVGFSGRGRFKDSQYGVQFAEKLGRQAMVGKAASAVFGQMVDVGMGDINDSELIDALRAIAAKPKAGH